MKPTIVELDKAEVEEAEVSLTSHLDYVIIVDSLDICSSIALLILVRTTCPSLGRDLPT